MAGFLDCPCPPDGLIGVVGKKWAICVVTLLGRNPTLRFGAIQKTLHHVSPATLTSTLRALEKAELVERARIDSNPPSRSSYALTRRGEALYRSLLPLASWLRQN